MLPGGLDKRVTYRRRRTWATASNQLKFVKTPGQKLTVHKVRKRTKGAHTPCYLGYKPIPGIKHIRHNTRDASNKRFRTVKRAYGGVLTHDLVRERIIRSFIIQEQRIVKEVMKKKRSSTKAKASKKN
mmetsp:Transcript_10286/g.15042  ORF Transcript_10286/g.15042 Transcript_10286/m.15042 type:complete len:128 (+) Transcript_10286:47-430(+)